MFMLTGTWVTVRNPLSWAYGMRGFIANVDKTLRCYFVQLDGRGNFAQVCVGLSDVEKELN